MKLCCQADIPNDDMAVCCRQSRVVGILQTVVWCVVLSLPPILGWNFRLWWLFWIGLILAIVLIPLIVQNLLLLFRPTNWVLRIGRDGLWLNLLTYRDKPTSAPSIVQFDYDELASAGKHVERYSTPTDDPDLMTSANVMSSKKMSGSTSWRSEFLELQLKQPQTGELLAALNQLRYPPAGAGEPERAITRPYPVWITNPTGIRIPWLSGHAHAVFPKLKNVLDQFTTYGSVAEPTQRDRADWRQLTPDEAKELARELVNIYGDDHAARNLLVRAAGLTSAEAMTLIGEIAKERAPSARE